MTRRGKVFKALLSIIGCLPMMANRSLGRGLGRLFRWLPNRTREITRQNIARCFPDLSAADQTALVSKTLTHIGYGFLELPLFWNRPPAQTLSLIRTIHGKEVFDDAINGSAGMLLAAPHLGAWELLCQYLTFRGDGTFLYREAKDPGISQVITEGRERQGSEMVKAGPRGVRRLFKALKENRMIGLLPDQQPKGGGGEFASFFGFETLTMVLYSKMAQRSDAPLVFAFAERLPGGRQFDLHFLKGDPQIRNASLPVSLNALNAQVETMVRSCPAQYQWGYKRFSIRPEGESPFYQ
ncbi:MAG: lysophospholipid acyltransferase family protein [Lysobacterales bacterium]